MASKISAPSARHKNPTENAIDQASVKLNEKCKVQQSTAVKASALKWQVVAFIGQKRDRCRSDSTCVGDGKRLTPASDTSTSAAG